MYLDALSNFSSYICNIFVYECKIWEWQRQLNLDAMWYDNDSSQRLIKKDDKTLKIHKCNLILHAQNISNE